VAAHPLSDLERAAQGGLGQQQRELLAAVAAEDVLGALGRVHDGAQGGQHTVAEDMSQGVIDVLEAIDVDEEHGEARVFTPGQLDAELQPFVETEPVRQSGQGVVEGQLLDAPARGHGFGEILDETDVVNGKSLAIRHPHQ